MSPKVLCVDDNSNVLAAVKRNSRKRFDIDTAEGGEIALAMMDRGGPYAVVVADMQMPGMNGIELPAKMRQKAPDTVRIMLTGNADQRTPRRCREPWARLSVPEQALSLRDYGRGAG